VPERQILWQALGTAALVAMAAVVGIAPYVYYLSRVRFAHLIGQQAPWRSPVELMRAELLSIGLVVLVAALVGTLAARRYGLVGIGDRALVRQARSLLLFAAPALGVLSYLLFGRALAARVPGIYPSSLGWALGHALKGALFDEVVARYGMMTILCGVVRNHHLANGLQAVFFTVQAVLGLSFFGVRPDLSSFFVANVAATFLTHMVLGAVFAKYGLAAVMLFHLGVGIQYPLHVAMAIR